MSERRNGPIFLFDITTYDACEFPLPANATAASHAHAGAAKCGLPGALKFAAWAVGFYTFERSVIARYV